MLQNLEKGTLRLQPSRHESLLWPFEVLPWRIINSTSNSHPGASSDVYKCGAASTLQRLDIQVPMPQNHRHHNLQLLIIPPPDLAKFRHCHAKTRLTLNREFCWEDFRQRKTPPFRLSSWASSCKASQAFVEVSSPGSEHCSHKNSWMLETHR